MRLDITIRRAPSVRGFFRLRAENFGSPIEKAYSFFNKSVPFRSKTFMP